ncbi:hypothetical protein [Tenacibaculum jejuense]|uniref:Uncharacterized protein n=1 Tax=Tenacibaculum jejuense TaxID=584609 RepID=A0A238U6E0_9FLAO|nr:hypothetical protein [Tenacibaculum jejuense]SNR14662.1 protein of unknown function [Tenacibaculum jejuense]
MEIIITKGKDRNTLTCQRENKTFTSYNLGPNLPNHDIAHYVIEKKFQFNKGFYGNIKSGMSIEELSDKEIIKNLEQEALLAEIMTRNLQAIGSGAAKIDDYISLVTWEANNLNNVQIPELNLKIIEELKIEFDHLCTQWEAISEGDQLKLSF